MKNKIVLGVLFLGVLIIANLVIASAAECRSQTDSCTISNNNCCDGLKPIKSCSLNQYGGCECAKCGTVCLPCGNGICDAGESKCNCAIDCNRNLNGLANNSLTINQTCAKENEQFSRVYNDYSKTCCEGLTEWDSGMDTREVKDGNCVETGRLSGNPVGTCIKCGDGVCGKNENLCNCASDCEKEIVSSIPQNKTCAIANETYTQNLSCCPGLRADKPTSTCIMEGKKVGWFKNMLGWMGRLFGKK